MSNKTKSIFSNAEQYLNDLNPSAVSDGRSAVGSRKKASALHFDSRFNFELVTFEIEGTLFQVVKNGFIVPGTIFETMFTLPVPSPEIGSLDTSAVEGSSPKNPIHLADVSAKDFRAFLTVLYPFMGTSVALVYEDWVGVLKLSTMWDFREIREKAISTLSTLLQNRTVLERISLGRAYRVYKWLRDEYVALAQEPLRLEELRDSSGVSLDWETIAKLAIVRQEFLSARAERCYNCSNYSSNSGQDQIPSVVDSFFEDEFREVQESGKGDS